MPRAQHTLLQTSVSEVSLTSVTREGLAVWRLQTEHCKPVEVALESLVEQVGCVTPGKQQQQRELTVGSSF